MAQLATRTATLTIRLDPIAPYRLVRQIPAGCGTFESIVMADDLRPFLPSMAMVCRDGVPILADAWDFVPRAGEAITIHPMVAGGGGGGKNPLKVIATIALIAYTGGLGSGLAGSAFATGGALAGYGGAFMLGGMLLINAAFPPPKPKIPAAGSSSIEQARQLSTISNTQNQARQYGAMMMIYGDVVVAPDYGAAPYNTYQGTDSYFNAIYHFGVTDCDLSEFKIGQTPLADYVDAQYELNDAYGRVALVSSNIDTIAGAVLSTTPQYRTVSGSPLEVVIDIVGSFYLYDERGNPTEARRSIAIYKNGFFWAAHNVYGDKGIGRLTLTYPAATWTEIGVAYSVDWPHDENRSKCELQFSIRALYNNNVDYSGQKRVALKIKASGQLQGQLQDFRARARTKIKCGIVGNETPTYSSNPAWILLDFLRGRVVGGELLYGVGASDAEIDLASIQAWANFCDAQGFTFNGAFRDVGSCGDFCALICTHGAASYSRGTGKHGVIFDDQNAPIVQRFGMANIVAGSFSVSYATNNLPDEAIVRYIEPSRQWQQDQVRILKPGVTTPKRTVEFTLDACTDKAMAGKIAAIQIARQYYQTRTVTWQADDEAIACDRGDRVELSHDMTQWGYSGRLAGVNGRDLTLDRKIPLEADQEAWIGIRWPDNTYKVLSIVAKTTTGEYDTVTLTNDLPTTDGGETLPALTNESAIDFIWIADFVATPGKRLMIVEKRHDGAGKWTLKATDCPDEFYASWGRAFTYIPPPQNSRLNPLITSTLQFAERLLTAQGETELTVAWTGANATLYAVSVSKNGNSIYAQTTDANFVRLSGLYQGDIIAARVVPKNLVTSGAAVSANYTIVGKGFPPADVEDLAIEITENGVVLSWAKCPDLDWSHTEIRQGADWASGVLMVKSKTTNHNAGWLLSGVHHFHVRHVDMSGNYSAVTASVSITINAPNAVNVIRKDMAANVLSMAWLEAKTSQPILRYEYWYQKAGTPLSESIYYGSAGSDGRNDLIRFPSAGEKVVYVIAYDLAGNASTPMSFSVYSTLPDDFVLASGYDEDWQVDEIVNGLVMGGTMGDIYLPVNTAETWGEHFSARGWNTAQDQVNAGYPIYIQPTPLTASHTEEHDIGKVIQSAQIVVTPTYTVLSDSAVAHIQIYYRAAPTDAWETQGIDIAAATALNVRYVKVVFSVEGDGKGLVRLENINVQAKSQEVTEFSRVACGAADTYLDHLGITRDGTKYTPQKSFLDIRSAVGTAISPNIKTIYGIPDDGSANPVVGWLCYDENNVRTSGEISIQLGGF